MRPSTYEQHRLRRTGLPESGLGTPGIHLVGVGACAGNDPGATAPSPTVHELNKLICAPPTASTTRAPEAGGRRPQVRARVVHVRPPPTCPDSSCLTGIGEFACRPGA